MKYKSKNYALVLTDFILKETTPSQEKKFSDNFLKKKKKNRDSNKAKEIINLAESLFFKKTGKKKIILETARKMSLEQKNLLKSLAKKSDIVEEKINKELIAGVKIIINNEKQIDFSMQKKLQNIF
ncbi:MAG: F0F1 ATP synthase subunit delta [Candidatus Staskawiczbacteria bacterium]|nr:F0F1 ATP synthase subunit delta [Candidatus Staskawiczbacteria bacterium]